MLFFGNCQPFEDVCSRWILLRPCHRAVKGNAVLLFDVVFTVPANVGWSCAHPDILLVYAACGARISAFRGYCRVPPARRAFQCAVLGRGRKDMVRGCVQPWCPIAVPASRCGLLRHVPSFGGTCGSPLATWYGALDVQLRRYCVSGPSCTVSAVVTMQGVGKRQRQGIGRISISCAAQQP